jgi:hypothetical protein
MSRINLTLDDRTELSLKKHAKIRGMGLPTFVRSILERAVAQYEQQEWNRKLAKDYSSECTDKDSLRCCTIWNSGNSILSITMRRQDERKEIFAW